MNAIYIGVWTVLVAVVCGFWGYANGYAAGIEDTEERWRNAVGRAGRQ